jgi:hypothetical protein
MWEKRNAYRTLAGKPKGKRLLRRPRHMWMDSIKMDLREIGMAVRLAVSQEGLILGKFQWNSVML